MAETEEPTGEAIPHVAHERPESAPSSAKAVVRALLLCDLVNSTKQVDEAGDRRAVEIMQRHDRVARGLLGEHGGREIDKTDGFFHLFELPIAAVRYALAYHQALTELSSEVGVDLSARVGIHLGEIWTWENSASDVEQGAKPLEVEGQAKQMAARLMALGAGRQTLLTSTAFTLAKRSAESESFALGWEWVAHAPYLFKGISEPVEVFEVGIRGFAPLCAPASSAKARPILGRTRVTSGSTLSHFEILDKLGEGGMGEVYRARDTEIGRQVAIKVLTPELAADRDSLERFRREAKSVAAINHPNIVTIHSVAEADGVHFLEMELIEGEGLDKILPKGGFGLDRLFELAIPIASALGAAHAAGITHRDLKPTNVMVTSEGGGDPARGSAGPGHPARIKLLDFGLAKPEAGPGGGDDTECHTASGTLVGTEPYMSPEQAQGKLAGPRSDVFSLGILLYAMATGEHPFRGDNPVSVASAVIRDEPHRITELRTDLPNHLARIVGRCLRKDRERRYPSAREVQIELEDLEKELAMAKIAAISDESDARGSVIKRPALESRGLLWMRVLPWAVALAAAAIALILSFGGRQNTALVTDATTEFGVLVPKNHVLPSDQTPILDLGVDGRTLVFVALGEEGRRVYRRQWDRIEARAIEGTEGAEHPILSHDGRWLAFVSRDKLRKVPVEGGQAITLADAVQHRGAAWAPDGSIIFSPLYTGGLLRLPPLGGAPEQLTVLDPALGDRSHRWPQVLPGGLWALFTVGAAHSPGDYDGATIDAVNLETRARRTLLRNARMARFAPPDHLLFQRESDLFAVRFDPVVGEVLSQPFSVAEDVAGQDSSGAGYFAASSQGTVALVPIGAIAGERVLVLMDPDGEVTEIPIPEQAYRHPRFSPDGRQLAFSISDGQASDIWTFDFELARLERLTFNSGSGIPLWSPDGRRIVFVSDTAEQVGGLYWKPADGSGPAERLAPPGVQTVPGSGPGLRIADSWLPDGSALVFTEVNATGSTSMVALWPISAEQREPVPLLDEPWAAQEASISPDGRFIAYTSAEAEELEIFVQSLADGTLGTGGKWQVSTGGGRFPTWSDDGRQLFFARDETVMVADVYTKESFSRGQPRGHIRGPFDLQTGGSNARWIPSRNFDVAADGRIVLVRRQFETAAREIVLRWGWSSTTSENATAP